jgi:hypothetical protein
MCSLLAPIIMNFSMVAAMIGSRADAAIDRAGRFVTAPLIEPDPYPCSLPPDRATGEAKRIARYHQVEFVGNADGAWHVERGASRGQVAHSTVDRAAAELNSARLQYPLSGKRSFLIHKVPPTPHACPFGAASLNVGRRGCQ